MIYDDFLKFLYKNKISPNQFTLCYMLSQVYNGKETPSIKPIFYEFVANFPKCFSEEEANDLIERGYLVNLDTNGKLRLDMLQATDKFNKLWFMDTFVGGEELWNLYPDWLYIKNTKVPAKSCSKDDVIGYYLKAINYNRKKHIMVLETLEKAIKDNMINSGIEKWVLSHQWEILIKYYNKEEEKVDFRSQMS